MIRYLIFRILFCENIISRISGIISRIYIRPHVPVYINIFNFRFSGRKSQSHQKLAKKMIHFAIQFCWKNLTHFILRTTTHLTLEIICCRNTAKNLCDFTKFPANTFLFGARKNICTAPFLDEKELLSWSTLYISIRYISPVYLLYISMRIFCSRDVIRFYVAGSGKAKWFA